MATSFMWRTGQEINVAVPQVMEEPVTKQETVEVLGEMPILSDAVDGISPLMNQCNSGPPEQVEDVLQFREETADVSWSRVNEGNRRPSRRQSKVGRLVPRERVQQRSAEKEILEVFENLSPGAHLEAYTDRRCASAADFRVHSPGAHLGTYTGCRGANAAEFGRIFPRSASRSVHRALMCQCCRLRKRPSEWWG